MSEHTTLIINWKSPYSYDDITNNPELRNGLYSGLNLNQYGVASPCRTICTVCGFVALS